jgi:hypothetical protein
VSDRQFPARWARGAHDDAPYYWARTFTGIPFGGTGFADIYGAPPDESGQPTEPPLAVNVNVAPDPTFRGLVRKDAWYAARSGRQGPKKYADRFATGWILLGEGEWTMIPRVKPTGALLPQEGLYADVTFPLNPGGAAPWAAAADFLGGMKFAAAWWHGDGGQVPTPYVIECADGE